MRLLKGKSAGCDAEDTCRHPLPCRQVEYRKKYSEAQKLYTGAAEDIKKIMTAAGVTQ
jgi:hypothetical protein